MAMPLLVPPCRNADVTPWARNSLAAQSIAWPFAMPPRSICVDGSVNRTVRVPASSTSA